MSMTETQIERQIEELARLHGVQTAYRDVEGHRREASPYALLAVLRALGAPVLTLKDVPGALREAEYLQWRRCCEPVVVAWAGEPVHMDLRLPADRAEGLAACRLELETGKVECWTADLSRLAVQQSVLVEGWEYVVRRLVLPPGLPWGYHRFTLTLPAGIWETLIIVAPEQAYTPPAQNGRLWGVFLPLYALHSDRSWGAGDLTDLEALSGWVRGLGGGMVGTLPLLAAFLDEPFDPSPYAPVSRLFWNEFYLDVTRVPELEQCPEAREVLASPGFGEEIAALRAAPLVDYRRGMAAKRRVLESLARCCFASDSGRQTALRRWAKAHPAADDYARFRAAVERQRAGWPVWPDRMRGGVLGEGDYDPEVERYHLYVQWLAHEQVEALSVQARQHGPGLYLDLPLGVYGGGYDVWRERAAFAPEASVGAPPDPFFDQGQDWGFPPLHPEHIREQGYRYFIACLRHHFQHAGVLRIDHVMGLHRLFWVPREMTAHDGVYVRYRAEEFWAILALESQRHRTLIVGEDLGTVPDYVRSAMGRHRIYRMSVLPFELTGNGDDGGHRVPADALTTLNTHDMPPFTAFWQEKDDAGRWAWSDYLHRKGWLAAPTDEVQAILRACLSYLADSPARVLQLNLEDLWLEAAPQNVPGTGVECPNWRRKARYPLEEFTRMPQVLEILREVNRLREEGTAR